MSSVVLQTMWDVDIALVHLSHGERVRVEVGIENGPDGPEPRVELLRVLLDTVQRKFQVGDLRWMPHPSVPMRYLHSCSIDPSGRRERQQGSRDPRSGRTRTATAHPIDQSREG